MAKDPGRPKQEEALVAAVRAVVGVAEACDAAVQALTRLGDCFVVAPTVSTFEEALDRPLGEAMGWQTPETLAVWSEIRSIRAYLAEDGDGSGFEFETLLTHELRDLVHAVGAWLEDERARPSTSSVEGLLAAFDGDRDYELLRRELDALLNDERPALAAVGGDDNAC